MLNYSVLYCLLGIRDFVCTAWISINMEACKWILPWLRQSQWFWDYLMRRYVFKPWQCCLHRDGSGDHTCQITVVYLKVVTNIFLLALSVKKMEFTVELFLIRYYPIPFSSITKAGTCHGSQQCHRLQIELDLFIHKWNKALCIFFPLFGILLFRLPL